MVEESTRGLPGIDYEVEDLPDGNVEARHFHRKPLSNAFKNFVDFHRLESDWLAAREAQPAPTTPGSQWYDYRKETKFSVSTHGSFTFYGESSTLGKGQYRDDTESWRRYHPEIDHELGEDTMFVWSRKIPQKYLKRLNPDTVAL